MFAIEATVYVAIRYAILFVSIFPVTRKTAMAAVSCATAVAAVEMFANATRRWWAAMEAAWMSALIRVIAAIAGRCAPTVRTV